MVGKVLCYYIGCDGCEFSSVEECESHGTVEKLLDDSTSFNNAVKILEEKGVNVTIELKKPSFKEKILNCFKRLKK